MKSRVSPMIVAASEGMAFYRKRSCPRCNQTGYRGRIGTYQLLSMSEQLEQLEQLAVSKASREELERASFSEG